MVYNVKHKTLLQAIVQAGVLDDHSTTNFVINIFNDDNVQKVINEINKELQILDMSIKKAQCEITGEFYWIFVNTLLDDINRFQEEYSKNQLDLLRNIFSELITSGNGFIQSTACLNLCTTLNIKIPIIEAEEFLKKVVERKWLAYENGVYYMGVRSIIELMPYFRATYDENFLNTCCLCKRIIFHGEKCSNCDNIIHTYCYKNYASVHNPVKCPKCNNILVTGNNSGANTDEG